MSSIRLSVVLSLFAGLVGLCMGSGCPTLPATGGTSVVGSASAGQGLYSQMCAGCHPSAASLASDANQIINNLGTINPAMSGITLTDQQVADLKAYLATLSSSGSGRGGGAGGGGGATGNASAGQALYSQMCAGCHPSPAGLNASVITNNMGSVNPAMSGITLTDQQVTDLKAYLATLSPSGGTGSSGQAIYASLCAGCHPSPGAVAGDASQITNNMGTINPAMNGITLTNDQVAALKAYLATVSPSGDDD